RIDVEEVPHAAVDLAPVNVSPRHSDPPRGTLPVRCPGERVVSGERAAAFGRARRGTVFPEPQRRQRSSARPQLIESPSVVEPAVFHYFPQRQDRKSTRLNSSHRTRSYASFCL